MLSAATILSAGATLLLGGCAADSGPPLDVATQVLESPAGPDSGEPYLSSDGSRVYLSWLEAVDEEEHALRFSSWEAGTWSEPRTIATSALFFVNWADFPSFTPGTDGTLWAHYLERGGKGTYDYAVRVVRSDDGGESWAEPVTPHDDRSPTEHGFVSTIPTTDGMGFVWLDGRRYAETEDRPATQEMTLQYRRLGSDGSRGEETELDGRVCDCCQTSSALTALGPVTVYRDRSPDEIRDIYITRQVDGQWTPGAPVHDDGWEIAGCPVNGPAVVASGSDVAVAWFTGADNVPRVKVAFSPDGGATFGDPVVVDDGNPAGRVDLLYTEDDAVLVSWLERTGGDAAEVRVRRVAENGMVSSSASLVGSSGARASGFPRMAEAPDGGLILAWTDLEGGVPQVRVARLVVDGESQ